MKIKYTSWCALFIVSFLLSWTGHAGTDRRLGNAYREDKEGWVFVHVEGSPDEIGYQHGYLLAPEIGNSIRALRFYLIHSTRKDWNFYRHAAKKMFWPKLTDEYRDEIKGIAKGLRARGRITIRSTSLP